MRVAICDDEKAQAALLQRLVRKWADKNGVDAASELFASAEAFLFAWPEDKGFDLLLLDIQMPGQSGMELARTIRRSDEALPIIFVTGYAEYMGEGYDVAALHYLLKPVNEQKLFDCLDRAVKKAAPDDAFLLVQHGGETLRLPQSGIVSVEAFAHGVRLTTADGALSVNRSIGELAGELDGARFVRPHRCYVVGLKYVRRIGREGLLLDTGATIPVSRRKFGEVNRAFIAYYRGERE